MFRTMGVAASGLSAQRARMETIATNIANAEVTRTPDGGPYKRRMVEMQAASATQFNDALGAALGVPAVPLPEAPVVLGDTPADRAYGVTVTGIVEDQSEGPLVYEPGHPDANAQGFVRYPNVSLTDEVVDLMDARRAYEANATVFQSAKAMLRRAIDI
ncbi:MAG: flagellar basal body rod protein FlgC [Gemmatimonadetes bacterium]|nr:flagellar basal body rod protein FlgC [Gemmatimonadota bacterium]